MKEKDRKLNVQPDIPDLRDRIYNPTLIGLETTYNSQPFADPACQARIKDQGETSACTGFALSEMIEGLVYHTWNKNVQQSAPPSVISPYMLYYFARRYDEIPGTDAGAGSTARGAMKAWHKHGACKLELWPKLDVSIRDDQRAEWIADAFRTPLGAYYRVDHTSIPDIHAAINETGFVYVTAQTHAGWDEPDPMGNIVFDNTLPQQGGHAFLLVGYDEEGFWIQNSWGREWGKEGFARLSYRDWTANCMDSWVAQLGVHVSVRAESLACGLPFTPSGARKSESASEPAPNLSSNASLSAQQINPYIINLTNNGNLSDSGQFASKPEDLRDLLSFYLPNALKAWEIKDQQPIDVAIYAHGGLTDENTAANTARWWVPSLFNQRVFPIFLMWETGFWDILGDIIADAFGDQARSGAAGAFWDKLGTKLKNFWNERLENMASKPGTAEWDEMKDNARAAIANKDGGLSLLARELEKPEYAAVRRRLRFHLIGHSAGSIVHSYLAPALVQANLAVDGVYFLAPACRSELFRGNVLPLYDKGKIASYTQFHMTDEVERRDNCGTIYKQSLLYLVSNAFEHKRETPILGMQKFVAPIVAEKPAKAAIWDFIASPTSPTNPSFRSNSTSHGGFDDDPDTRAAVLTRIAKRQEIGAGAGARVKRPSRARKSAKGRKRPGKK
ncbi:MAG: hypothetical protein QOH88_1365 [Verrucomicrobiota bacterium]|jgi:predicted alpha/beta hydrolase family esterase